MHILLLERRKHCPTNISLPESIHKTPKLSATCVSSYPNAVRRLMIVPQEILLYDRII
jgi:hypothetical protein